MPSDTELENYFKIMFLIPPSKFSIVRPTIPKQIIKLKLTIHNLYVLHINYEILLNIMLHLHYVFSVHFNMHFFQPILDNCDALITNHIIKCT